jgi:phosphoribosyl 1,2-cyclic phosphodiesterase
LQILQKSGHKRDQGMILSGITLQGISTVKNLRGKELFYQPFASFAKMKKDRLNDAEVNMFLPTFATMSLMISSLNSGSNGNCYFIGNRHDAVLIDAGISCRETERRMARLHLPFEHVRAIFITHEHTDHTRGVETLSRKHRIPVYITPETHFSSRLHLEQPLLKHFMAHEPVHINSLTVNPFPKKHDGKDPHSFTVSFEGVTAGVFTDIGTPCEHVIHHISQCHAAFLEANYDEIMLEKGSYPIYLKRRIRGDEGHLSNAQALEIFTRHRSPYMKLLVLSHLSAQNNHPRIVRELFAPHANGTRIEIASRYAESEVFHISAPGASHHP